jgi:hypothetical protein
MSARRTTMASLVAMLTLLAAPVPGRAQAPADTNQLKAELAAVQAQIDELDDIKSKIEADTHVLLLDPAGAAAFLEAERVESLFVTRLMEGAMTPQRAAEAARTIGNATRIYLNDIIIPDLEKAMEYRKNLADALDRLRHPDRTPVKSGINWPVMTEGGYMDWTKVVATARGTYLINCRRNNNEPRSFSGKFRLDLLGNGRVTATFESGSFQWPIEGAIDAAGLAGGEAFHPDGIYGWAAQFQRDVDVLRIPMESSWTTLRPADDDLICNIGQLYQVDG